MDMTAMLLVLLIAATVLCAATLSVRRRNDRET
jgi:hypothetical protein